MRGKNLTFKEIELFRTLYRLEMSNADLSKYFQKNPATIFRLIQKLGLRQERLSSQEIVRQYREKRKQEQIEEIKKFEDKNNLK